jgi:hypothetical protein
LDLLTSYSHNSGPQVITALSLIYRHFIFHRDITQAFSHWLLTAAAGEVPVAFAVDKVVPGQVFYEYFYFTYQISFTNCSTIITIYHLALVQ